MSETIARGRRSSLAAACVFIAGAVLRLSLLSGFRFHPDEALYATWARFIASGQDPMLAEHLVDKPPLFIYFLASLFGTLGASEEIARLPSQAASACALVLVYAIGMQLYRSRRVALTAAVVLALSPISILFAPTAFTDPLMTTLLLAAIWCGLRGKFLLGGLAYGMALATKQDAVLVAPLMVGLMFVGRGEFSTKMSGLAVRRFVRFAAGIAGPVVMVIGWSVTRPQPDFLQASLANYGGFNLAAPEVYVSRALEWLPLLRTLTSDWLLMLAMVMAPVIVLRERRRADIVLVGMALAWLLVHVAFMIPAWDRYVLPLAPLAALLVARSSVFVYEWFAARSAKVAVAVSAALLMVLPAQAAMRDEIHAGRDYNVHAGVEQVGQWFWQIDTTATILYDHDLSWELDYYTFGRGLDRRWFVDGDQLAQDAAHMPLARRFVVVAEWEALSGELSEALARERMSLAPVFVARRPDGSESVTVYMIVPESGAGLARSDRAPGAR